MFSFLQFLYSHPPRPPPEMTLTDAVTKKDVRKVEECMKRDIQKIETEIKNNNLIHLAVQYDKDAWIMLSHLLKIREDSIESILLKKFDGATALHGAARNQRARCCSTLIRKCPSALAELDKAKNSPLHYIVANNMYSVLEELAKVFNQLDDNVQKLIRRVIDLPNSESKGAIHLAAEGKSRQILEKLIKLGGQIDLKTNEDFTALHYAAINGSLNCVESLLNASKQFIDAKTKYGMTALMYAAKKGSKRICEALDEADITLVDEQRNTVIHHVAFNGSLSVMQYFVQKKNASLTAVNKYGEIPLHSCIRNNRASICSYLLGLMADEDILDTYIPVLVKHAVAKSMRCLGILAKRSKFHEEIINYRDEMGNTLLHKAIASLNVVTARSILEIPDMPKDIKNKNDDSPLHILSNLRECLFNGRDEDRQYVTRELLCDSHELLDEGNKRNESPFYLASCAGKYNIVHSMLMKNPNYLKRNGHNDLTAVHGAADAGEARCLKLLLTTMNDAQKQQLHQIQPSPLHLAAKRGFSDCCDIILADQKVKRSLKVVCTMYWSKTCWSY